MPSTADFGARDAGTLVSGGSLRLISAGVGLIGGLLVTVLLVRALGVPDFGAYAFALSVSSLVAILAELGLGNGLSRMGAFFDNDRSGAWARTSFKVAAASGCGLTAATLLLVPLVPSGTRAPIAVAAPLVLIGSLSSVERGFLAASRRIALAEGITIATQVATYLLVLALVFSGHASAVTVLGAQVVSRAIGVGCLAIACGRALATSSPRERVLPREVLAFSMPLMLAGIAGTVLQRSDVVLIGVIAGTAAVGSYEPILRIFDVAPLIVASLGYYFFPVGASLVRRRDFRRLRAAYVSVSKWGMVLTMPLLITLLIAPVPVLEALFGGQFSDSRAVASTLAVGYIVNVVAGVNGGALVALGATRQIAVRSVALIVCNLGANLLLIPWLGALGAALATTIVTVALNAFNSLLAWRMARLTPFRRDTVLYLLTVAVSTVIAGAMAMPRMQSSLAGSLIVFMSVLISGSVVAALTLHPGERRLVRSLVSRVGHAAHRRGSMAEDPRGAQHEATAQVAPDPGGTG